MKEMGEQDWATKMSAAYKTLEKRNHSNWTKTHDKMS